MKTDLVFVSVTTLEASELLLCLSIWNVTLLFVFC